MVTLAHPEGELWVVVPKEEWERMFHGPEEVLELAEKQVAGRSFREAIAEAEKDAEEEALKLLPKDYPEENREKVINLYKRDDPAVRSLEWQLRTLVAALENAEIEVEPTEKMTQMTEEYLDWLENRLLHPEPTPVWDSPSA